MQLLIVAAIMPSLLLLSRTRGYPFLRIGGALFAGFAAAGWIAERAFGLNLSVSMAVNLVAHRAIWLAGGLATISLLNWSLRRANDAGIRRDLAYWPRGIRPFR